MIFYGRHNLNILNKDFNPNSTSFSEDYNNIENQNKFIEVKENFSDVNNYLKIFSTQNNPSLIEELNYDMRKTESSSEEFLNNKRFPEKSELSILFENQQENNTIKAKFDNIGKPKGRKKKGDNEIETDKKTHNKFSEDNIIKKIKVFLFQYNLELLNNSFKDKCLQFSKLPKYINEGLKKEFNEKLLERTFYDIYKNSYYDPQFKIKCKYNGKIIDKIFKENIETEVINILNMTFTDFLDYIREKDLENFLDKIKDKEIKRGDIKYLDKYIMKVKNLLFKYEDWFHMKSPRERKKNKIIKMS